jgi:hypothetical protein
MSGFNPIGIIFWLGLMIWAFCILSIKGRGFGYYVLAFFFPLIGLIVAACLKNKSPIDKKEAHDITDVKD